MYRSGVHATNAPVGPKDTVVMAVISLRTVIVYEAWRDGRRLGVDTDRERLCRTFRLRPDAHRIRIDEYEEAVGIIDGEVSDWNADEAIEKPALKLAASCPACGYLQWADYYGGMPNPTLWYAECDCIGKWLVYWHFLNAPDSEVNPMSGKTE